MRGFWTGLHRGNGSLPLRYGVVSEHEGGLGEAPGLLVGDNQARDGSGLSAINGLVKVEARLASRKNSSHDDNRVINWA